MPIKVTCKNILRFDKEAGQYVYCNRSITVQDAEIGGVIECPDCGGSVEAVSAEPADLGAAKDEELEQVPVASTQANWTFEQPKEKPKPRIRKAKEVPCINCHTPLPRDTVACPSCGYEQPSEIESPDGPTGFQYWFQQQLAEGTSPLGVLLATLAFFGVFMFLCLAYSIIVYGFRVLMWLSTPLFLIFILMVVLVLAGRRPNESLIGVTRRVLNPWNIVLVFWRAWGWRHGSMPFRRRKSLDRRDMQFGDEDLLELDDFDKYRVMDLEGTQVTDEAMESLRDADSLEFLVVRRTQVTKGCITRLQQYRPHLWVWI